MGETNTERLGYFHYRKLARQELQALLDRYPEISALSGRELEVFELLLSDKTLSRIAEEMGISPSSVHFHCKNIYKKLNISSRRQLLLSYIDLCQHTETM